MKRLSEGVTTSFEVLQLQKDFSDARSREFAALADLNKAIVDLQLATGTLLEQQGVELVSGAAESRRRFADVPVVMIGEDEPADWQPGDDAPGDETSPAPARPIRPAFSKAKRR